MGSLLYEVAVSRRAHDGREIHEVRVQIPSSGLYTVGQVYSVRHQGYAARIITVEIDDYIELYKKVGYIREMRKYVGHAPILTCACGVIIENDKGEILLQKRKDNGCWAIIGGAMEMGETFEETIRRETMEESGLSLGRLDVFQLYSGKDRIIEYPNGDICFGPGIVFITREYEGVMINDPDEVVEHRFFKKTELPDNLNRYDKDIILEWAGRERKT